MENVDFAGIQRLNAVVGHLSTQFETAKPVLFTGAGFSLDAKNITHQPIPGVDALRRRLWELCFGDDPFEESNSLQDLYQLARTQRRKELTDYLTAELSVDSGTLPAWYREVFRFPWHRIYTLNVDNLAQAVDRAFDLPRSIKVTSATSELRSEFVDERANLHVIHLNGTLADAPDGITFSFGQYAERLTRDEPWYHQLISDLLSRPVVFVGTQLDEPPLWQYIEKRRSRGGRVQKELRPKSYLVAPSLSKARQSCLLDYNISHLPMTAAEFAGTVLAKLYEPARLGQQFLVELSRREKGDELSVRDVASLSINPTEKTEFLLGAEPAWSDIQSGRAICRRIDAEISVSADKLLAGSKMKGVLLISGTAGTGKGTSLKRLSLKLSSEGHHTNEHLRILLEKLEHAYLSLAVAK